MAARIPVNDKCVLLLNKEIMVVKKHNSLYLGLVLPSGGWQILIATDDSLNNASAFCVLTVPCEATVISSQKI